MKAASLITPPRQIELGELRLGNACALLSHGGVSSEQIATESDAEYLQRVIDSLCDLSLRDPLTGLANRRHFLSVLAREIAIVARSGDSTLLLMLDIDHFKQVNDTHGHPVGDRVLQVVAECLTGCVRPKDTVVRYGGEEFAVILPDCPVTYGMLIAERMRETLQNLNIAVSPDISLNVTMSIGGAYAPTGPDSHANLWIDQADKELYRAKNCGRNRVCIDQPMLVEVTPEEKSQLYIDFSQNDSIWGDSVLGSDFPADASSAPASDTQEMMAEKFEQGTP